MELAKLQNGSDIRGVASEGIPGEGVTLTDEAVYALTRAFINWLAGKTGKQEVRIAVGRDSRISGPRILNAVKKASLEAGASLYDAGLASTPAMFMTTVTEGFGYDGAIMITASHLPFNRNGLKFFTSGGGLEKADIAELIRLGEGDFAAAPGKGSYEQIDFMSTYAAQLANKIKTATGKEKPLAGMKIAVDAGNGAGGFYAEKVLAPLGADTSASQFLEPDGAFPNHIPNPENEEAMRSIQQAVLNNGADLGVIFDTDVDRAGAVDHEGREINRNRLIALISAILLEETPGTTIVTDSVTSSGLAKFIAAKGGVHHRFARGYKNVINEAIRLNGEGQDCQLAIETSGHAALKENYFLDDGAYLMTKIIIKMAQMAAEGKELSSLIDSLEEPADAAEVRFKITAQDFKARGAEVLAKLEQAVREDDRCRIAPDNHEGIRFDLGKEDGDGWILVRMSLHDPVMPVNMESDQPGGVKKLARVLTELLGACEGVDVSPLEAYL